MTVKKNRNTNGARIEMFKGIPKTRLIQLKKGKNNMRN